MRVPLCLRQCRRSGVGRLGDTGEGLQWPTRASKAWLVCTALLYISVRGDSALKSNYTTITSSLIKLRATRLIQPCDPAERAHGSLHCSDIIQSVLQRRTANWWCCYVCGAVSQLWSGLWLQSRVTPSNYSLMFPTVRYLIRVSQKSTFERFFVSNSESFGSQRWSDREKFHFKMNNLAFEMWHLLLHTWNKNEMYY